MKRKAIITTIVMVVLMSTLVTGCKKDSNNTPAPKKVSDTFVSITIGEPDTLDMHQAYDSASREVVMNIYDALIEYDRESVTVYKPRLSENVPSVADGTIRDGGKTYEFTLRSGVKFHNGNDLTPEDVEYTFERALLLDPDGSPNWMLIDPLFNNHRTVKVVEDYTGAAWSDMINDDGTAKAEYKDKLIKFYKEIIDPAIETNGNKIIFTLAKPFPPFLNILCQYALNGYIIDKEWSIEKGLWNGNADGWWKSYNPKKEDSPIYTSANGTGPYKLVEWDRTQKKVTLERNESYWRGPAALRKFVLQSVDEWSTRKAMLEKGEADVIYADAPLIDQAKSISNATVYGDKPRMSLDAGQFNWLISDDSKYIGSGKLDGAGIPIDFFSDINVRKGFLHAFDQDTFVNDVMKGLGAILPSCLIKGLLGYDDSIKGNEFDLAKATQYFKDAYNGKLWNTGFTMTMTYNNGNANRQNAAELLSARLAEINPKFKVETRGIEWPAFLDGFKNGHLPFYLIGWGADYPDPHNFVFTYYHSSGDYGAFYGDNYKAFAAKSVAELDGKSLDAAIEEASVTTDKNVRIALYKKIQQFVIAQGVGLPIVQPTGFIVMSNDVKGWYFNPIMDVNYYDASVLSK